MPYGAPPYIVDENDYAPEIFEKYPDLEYWRRPPGPLRVGLQAGHWKNSELPEELDKLRPSTGSSGLGVPEWQVNLNIAKASKLILEKEGIIVDLLPATVPSGYQADAFVAIHADGSLDRSVHGYKVASPRRDRSGLADILKNIIETQYGEQTKLRLDPNVSRNMTGYYAFNWRRFEHSIHPMTPSVILETGFMTNSSNARLLINNPEVPAAALAEAIIIFLEQSYPELVSL